MNEEDMPLNEWHDRSFLIELKPRAEFASLFVDCPPNNLCQTVTDPDHQYNAYQNRRPPPKKELVKVAEHALELDNLQSENGTEPTEKHHKFVADISDLCLYPNTVCGLTWADHRRLFMCKVHAEPDGPPLVAKTINRLAKDIRGQTCLDDYVFDAKSLPIYITCSNCNLTLFADSTGECELVALPDDDWLSTAPNMDYLCREQCGRHSPNRPATPTDRGRWLPSIVAPKRLVLADSFCLVRKEQTLSCVTAMAQSGPLAQKALRCSNCLAELGRAIRSDPSVFELYHSVTNFRVDSIITPTFLPQRFGTMEKYFAWLLMSQCDAQSSMKLVVRSMDKHPYLLVWLLEPYVVLTNGHLRETDEAGNGEEKTHSFPALKMVYKVFDVQSALSDPRANGQDASVGLIEQPYQSCVHLTELLLTSSHALPPACRSVGQLYVGFLKLGDTID